MPTYTYKCNNCEEVFDKTHSINDVLNDCELCNENNCLKKVLTFVNINTDTSGQKTSGESVRTYIEDNRGQLSDLKKELTGRKLSD